MSLKSINISIEDARKDVSLDGIDWVSLDTVLDTPNFRALEAVTIQIIVWTTIEADFVERNLPLLHARKILTCAVRLQ